MREQWRRVDIIPFDELRPVAYPHHVSKGSKKYGNHGNDVPGFTFFLFFSLSFPDIRCLWRGAIRAYCKTTRTESGRAVLQRCELCARSKYPAAGSFSNPGPEAKIPSYSRRIALSPPQTGRNQHLDPFLDKSALIWIRRPHT